MADKTAANNDGYTIDCAEECSSVAETELDRQFPRTKFWGSTQAIVYPPDGTNAQPVRCTVLMRDLSYSGFGIAHTEKFVPGQRIELELEVKRLVGRIQWCHLTELGFYLMGCRIVTSAVPNGVPLLREFCDGQEQ